jgi:hypothetical protein
MILILLMNSAYLSSQIPDSAVTDNKSYSVTIEAMGGASYNLEENSFNSDKLNFSPSFRLMWRPDHRLYMGLETTYIIVRTTEYEKNRKNFEGKLEAMPLFLVVMMDIYGIDLIGGLGAAYVRSMIDASNEISVATNWHYCFNFGLGYTIDLSDSFAGGLEAKLFSLTKTDEITGGVYLKFIYSIRY